MKSTVFFILIFYFVVGAQCNSPQQLAESTTPKKEYSLVLKEIIETRDAFKKRYDNADNAEKKSIIAEAESYIFNAITTEVFPQWYGTKWEFYGTTRVPREGAIACGYFVTNVLTDVGFNIPRVKWAQSASEVFIKKLSPDDIKRFSSRPITEVESYLAPKGDGLYLAGLDSHVGFIVVKDGKMSFVHSNYYKANEGVMAEKIDSKNPLSDSEYRVIGRLLSEEMVVNWITGGAYTID